MEVCVCEDSDCGSGFEKFVRMKKCVRIAY